MTLNLIIATLYNDLSTINELLDQFSTSENARQCDVNFQDPKNGNTALHYAVKMGNFKIIETLLFYGADRSLANFNGILPMEQYAEPNIDPTFYYSEEYQKRPDYVSSKRSINFVKKGFNLLSYIFGSPKIRLLKNKLL
jgi:ankyrin repeat protein